MCMPPLPRSRQAPHADQIVKPVAERLLAELQYVSLSVFLSLVLKSFLNFFTSVFVTESGAVSAVRDGSINYYVYPLISQDLI